jgi:hypothetical protein
MAAAPRKRRKFTPLAAVAGSDTALFDNLIGAAKQREWHCEAQRLGGLHVDDQFNLRDLLHRQVSGLLALENATSVHADRTGPKIDRVGGVVYPTVQMRGAADNVAIWPEFVRSCLQLRSVRYILIEQSDRTNASYTFQLLSISQQFDSEEIIWQELNTPMPARRNYISFENGHWIHRNSAFEICDIH